jgi:hypothetical protein
MINGRSTTTPRTTRRGSDRAAARGVTDSRLRLRGRAFRRGSPRPPGERARPAPNDELLASVFRERMADECVSVPMPHPVLGLEPLHDLHVLGWIARAD